jgi:hypothetical protein
MKGLLPPEALILRSVMHSPGQFGPASASFDQRMMSKE